VVLEDQMKKISIILALIMFFAVASASLAADEKTKALFDDLLKIAEKCTNNASVSMEAKSTMNGKEFVTKLKLYFKDMKNFRMDSDTNGQKMRMVVTPAAAWTFVESSNVIMTMDPAAAGNFNVKELIEKQKESSEITESKDGDNRVFTIVDKESKNKNTYAIDSKTGCYVKMSVHNGKGELLTEATYSDWKFDKIDDALFKKPEGAKEVPMPEKGRK